MATERAASPMAEFMKFTKIGQSVAGYVSRHFVNDNGPSIALEPCVVWLKPDEEKGKVFGSIAVGLSADLRYRLTKEDVGSLVRITYTGSTKVADKPSPKKLFKLLILDAKEMRELMNESDATNKGNPFHSIAGVMADEEDDLPF